VARAGSTGRSTGAHVHFEENGRVVNPRSLGDGPTLAGGKTGRGWRVAVERSRLETGRSAPSQMSRCHDRRPAPCFVSGRQGRKPALHSNRFLNVQ
jgi:hypothetical protein